MKNHKYHMKSHKFVLAAFPLTAFSLYHFQKPSAACTVEEFAVFYLSLVKSQTDE